MSKKPVLLGTILAGMIVIAILSAGCVGAFSYCPDEVKVHGNIIAVDENVVGEETIRQLLFSPNSYESSYISAIESSLPKKSPVLEIGAKFGVVTAFVDDILNKGVAHIVLERDPENFELLKKTIKNNDIVVDALNIEVTYDYDKLINEGNATTISSLIESYVTLEDKDNITLLIDDDNVAKSCFSVDSSAISKHVENVIINLKDSSLVKSVIKLASLAGYTNITYPVQGSDGYTVLVFKRMNNNTDGLTLNNELGGTNDTTPVTEPTPGTETTPVTESTPGTETTPKIDAEVKVA